MKANTTVFASIAASLIIAWCAHAAGAPTVTVDGCVTTPLFLSMADLAAFCQSDVRLNDIRRTGAFKGVFTLRGVPLKTLLTLSGIQKKDTDFKKPVDLAVAVRSASGEQVVLSWGEIFYKNPDQVVLALSSTPVIPHKGPDHFKDKGAYQEMMNTLHRTMAFPRLVVSGDLYSDRCLESVSEISVIDLKPEVEGEKSPSVYSEGFSIAGPGLPPRKFTELPDLPETAIRAHVVGEGRGYHGTHDFSGISLRSLLDHAAVDGGLNTVFIISAPDAYRSLVSYGELALGALGDRILLTDRVDGKPWENGGRFILVLPDDLMADREVKAVGKIEVIHMPK